MSDETEETTAQTGRSWFGIGLLLLVAVVVGYPLSVGPAAFIHSRCDLHGTAFGTFIETAYRPLSLLDQLMPNSVPVRFLHWWVMLWT